LSAGFGKSTLILLYSKLSADFIGLEFWDMLFPAGFLLDSTNEKHLHLLLKV
jgi:hypothetical protein